MYRLIRYNKILFDNFVIFAGINSQTALCAYDLCRTLCSINHLFI